MEVNGDGNVDSSSPPDRSVLNNSVHTGISGSEQVVRCLQSGTAEIRDLLLNECELVYECRACRNLFRSLANFVYHKREFCKKHFCESMVLFRTEDMPQEMVIVQPKSPECATVENGECADGYQSDDMETDETSEEPALGTGTAKICSLPESTVKSTLKSNKTEDLSTESGDASHTTSAASFYKKCEEGLQKEAAIHAANTKKSVVTLKRIDNNSNAVFQSMRDITAASSSEVGKQEEPLTIHQIREKMEAARTAIVHVDESATYHRRQRHDSDNTTSVINRLKERGNCNVDTLMCHICQTQYMSVKTLDFHMRTIHSDYRLYYPCCFCKTSFVQLWGVTRHMISVHKRTKEQASKLREVVRRKAYRKNPVPGSTKQAKGTDADATIENGRKTENKVAVDRKMTSKEELKTVAKAPIKQASNTMVHKCNKCGRGFDRKSSQVTHSKYCVRSSSSLTARKPNPGGNKKQVNPESPTHSLPLASAAPTKPTKAEPVIDQPASLNSRPKRNAKKKKEDDFVDITSIGYSRILNKPSTPSQKQTLAALEKNISTIVNTKHLQCLKCNRRFSTFSNLRRHAAIHVGWHRFKCKYCDYQSYNRSDCRNHIQRVHLQGKMSEVAVDKLVILLPAPHLKKVSAEKSPPVATRKVSQCQAAKLQDTPTKHIHGEVVAQQSSPLSSKSSPLSSKSSSFSSKSNKSTPASTPTSSPTKVTPKPKSSAGSNRVATRQAKTGSVPNEPSSSVSGSGNESVMYHVSTRHTVRLSNDENPSSDAEDVMQTLVTRSGKYRKIDLIRNLQNKLRAAQKPEPDKSEVDTSPPKSSQCVKLDRQEEEPSSPDCVKNHELFSEPLSEEYVLTGDQIEVAQDEFVTTESSTPAGSPIPYGLFVSDSEGEDPL